MTQTIIFRCDIFPGSGAGHIKRCVVLAHGLAAVGFSPIFALDRNSGPLPVEITYPIERVDGPFDVNDDARAMKELAHRLGTRVILGDSYRISETWVTDLRAAGLDVFLIDDLGVGRDATLRIDYSPQPKRIHGSCVNLLGPFYFITDTQKLTGRAAPAKTMILHAGGTGNFEAAEYVYRAAATVAQDKGLEVTWLCPNEVSLTWLSSSGLQKNGATVISWQNGVNDLWSHYDIVVGPASTSLFEAILQGALPISFPISATQSSERELWLQLGHALHLEHADLLNYEFAARILELAIEMFGPLRSQLTKYSNLLDGQGVERVLAAIVKVTMGNRPDIAYEPPKSAPIRACDLRDASRFLTARNARKVRDLSTDPDHVISWPEHLRWWLAETTERFVVESDTGPEAFFWHRPKVVSGQNYLIGGWFPAGSRNAFAAVIRLLEWQLDYCERRYPDHIWVATINQENRAVLALNRRYGFVDAESQVRDAVQDLFPGTSSEFVILQRKAQLP
jgi:spore coat polysaccharide biosynthesis predicted glycosyltransferase SpsG